MLSTQPDVNSLCDPGSCSTRLPDTGAAGIANPDTPVSGVPDIQAFSLKRKCQATESNATVTLGCADRKINAIPLKIRRCSESQLDVHSQNIPSREGLGGKGMFLTLMQNAGLPVPPFRCIKTDTVQALENVQLDVRPLLATLKDGHEFPDETASLAAMKRWIARMDPSEQQQRWLEALYSFVAGPDCYQQIRALPIADTLRTVYEDLRTGLTPPDSPVIVRSSGVAEDSFGNAQAGKYESVVHGQADIVATCLQVLASAYRPAVFSQQATQGMSIILQQCIPCRVVGGHELSWH
nr:PEP/pyruvate-binding domain-containing protein [Endozoicomonas sp. SCSIO W0465]